MQNDEQKKDGSTDCEQKNAGAISHIQAARRLHDRRQYRLAAYSLACDPKKLEQSSALIPLAPAFKEL